MTREPLIDRNVPICPRHQDKEIVPLIWTFAFPYNEYWCPACGYIHGMMGVDREKWSWKLHNTMLRYKDKAKRFLNSYGYFTCVEFDYKGKRLKPSEMPEGMRKYHKRIVNSYKYKFK